MMIITYKRIKKRENLFRTLTSLTPSEFEILLLFFVKAYALYIARKIGETERKRAYGGGRKPVSEKAEDMLLSVLFYFKLYPLQELIGFLFGMGQSQANEWIHRLTEVLQMTLSALNCLPEREPHKLEMTLTGDGGKEFAIDASERRIQRPKDDEKQRKFFSGRKKNHTVKNNLIVSSEGRKVKYLSGTCEGKKHDKKLCDEEGLNFPEGITLYGDTGYQGYEPEGADMRRPKKKPRGGELTVEEKIENSIISGTRIVAEHVISGVKRCRIVKDVFRNTKQKFVDAVMEIACGLHNFRTGFR